MNLVKLKHKLEELDIPKNAYSLSGGLPNESYCIAIHNDIWEVYYSERGNKTGLKVFADEASACDCFLELIAHLGK